MSDTIPDVPPPVNAANAANAAAAAPPTAPPKALISGPNAFFMWLFVLLAYLIYNRYSWYCVEYLLAGRMSDTINYIKWLWFIPILGILFSIIVPSLGTTSAWLIGSSIALSIPCTVAWCIVLYYGKAS